jgi:hypothetical protein
MCKRGYLFLILTAAAAGLIGCGKTQNVSAAASQADGNLAPVAAEGQPEAGQPAEAYPAPPAGTTPPTYDQAYQPAYDQAYEQDADEGGAAVYASEPPPPLPEYNQPPCPGDNYIWTPGYWGYADADYYWVPGVWVMAPYVDALWTPPYWEAYGGRYRWHRGYWGNHIGFYGGINYGFGYTGRGYYGGYWNGGRFAYNRTVTNVNVNIVHNVYQRPVTNTTINRISYNGGRGGINARPVAAEAEVLRERRTPPVAAQMQHARSAEGNRQQFASVNRGRPVVVAQNNALATPYRAPASQPVGQELPRRAVQAQPPRAAQAPAPVQTPIQRPGQNERPFAPGRPDRMQQPGVRGERPEVGRQAPEPRPVTPEARPGVPAQRIPDPRGFGGRQEAQRPQGQVRQQPAPAPVEQPRPQPEFTRPVPQARPVAPEPRQAPQVREPRPQIQARPEPQGRPEREARPQPQARPEPQARPAAPPPQAARPPQQARPEPAARPAAPPAQAARPAPEGRGRGEDKRH